MMAVGWSAYWDSPACLRQYFLIQTKCATGQTYQTKKHWWAITSSPRIFRGHLYFTDVKEASFFKLSAMKYLPCTESTPYTSNQGFPAHTAKSFWHVAHFSTTSAWPIIRMLIWSLVPVKRWAWVIYITQRVVKVSPVSPAHLVNSIPQLVYVSSSCRSYVEFIQSVAVYSCR